MWVIFDSNEVDQFIKSINLDIVECIVSIWNTSEVRISLPGKVFEFKFKTPSTAKKVAYQLTCLASDDSKEVYYKFDGFRNSDNVWCGDRFKIHGMGREL